MCSGAKKDIAWPDPRHLIQIKSRIFLRFVRWCLRNGFVRSYTHAKSKPTAHAWRTTIARRESAPNTLQFFPSHFHLKTIHSRWKMTRELRCNKWKFQIVVPFLSCDQHSTARIFWCFFFSSFLLPSLLDWISGFPPICLCCNLNSLLLKPNTKLIFQNFSFGN